MFKNGNTVFVTLMLQLINNVSKCNKMQINNFYNFYEIFHFKMVLDTSKYIKKILFTQ